LAFHLIVFGLFNPRGDEYMSADVYRNPIMRDFFLKYHDDMDWYNYFEDASHNSVTILRYLYGWHDLENVYMDVVWYDALFDSDQDTVDYLPIEPDDFEHFQVFDMFGEALTDELNELNSTIPLTQEPIFIRWFQPASVDQDKLSAPTNFIIQSLYPNPFNSEVKLQFSLKYPSPINVRLVNLNGRVMWQDDMELQREGDHSLSISAGELPSGVYFVRVGNEREVLNRKVVLLR